LALDHLRETLTKGNLWLYVLTILRERESASPGELKRAVEEYYGFSPAAITFYAVLYKLRREGLVKRSSREFRSGYSITQRGLSELEKAREMLDQVSRKLWSAGEPG
jgi:DNA-binding PadR family transcriptional regulator